MKAAVIGSLWAVVEIIPGSLLHNLKIPFAGSILSFITVYLVISYFQIWKENGIIWRAGIICALMKSISPSAVILGPMLGILSEAFILELVIRIIGKNLAAFIIGGALAVFSALVQKAFTLLILYGGDIIPVLENMYLFSARQLRMDYLQPSHLLILISAIYLTSGALAGLMGYMAGRKYITSRKVNNTEIHLNSKAKNDLFEFADKKKYSLLLLIIIFLFLVGGMVLITHMSLIWSALFTALFTGFMLMRYRHRLGYFKKPGLWWQVLFILLFSSAFHNEFSPGRGLEAEGLLVGVRMVLRVFILLSGFAAISVELKNPLVKSILYTRGLKNLYQSLELAFSALPGLMEAFSVQAKEIKGFRKLTETMLASSQSLLDRFTDYGKNRPVVFIICGRVNGGKTTLVRKIVSELQNDGLHIKGIFSPGNTNDSSRNAYYVEDISSHKRKLLCSEKNLQNAFRQGRYYFSAEGLLYGNKILTESITKPVDLIVTDELGPLEINDKGWAPALNMLLTSGKVPHMWVVRESHVNTMIRKWNVGKVFVFHINKDTLPEIINTIRNILKNKSLEA
ncbi:MAG: nucleoside-triphosphatase [Bacteroidales bacterium]